MSLKHAVLLVMNKKATEEARTKGIIGNNEVYCKDVIIGAYQYLGWESTWFDKSIRDRIKSEVGEMAKQQGIELAEDDEVALLYSPESKDYYVMEGITHFSSLTGTNTAELKDILDKRETYGRILADNDKERGFY